MNRTITMTRMIFTLVAILVAITYSVTFLPEVAIPLSLGLGVLCGTIFSFLVIALDMSVKQLDLRGFNTILIGLFVGYLLGQVILFVGSDLFYTAAITIPSTAETILSSLITLSSLYIGVIVTSRAAEDIAIQIPFIRLTPKQSKKKDVILCPSVLADPRLIDLAASGLLDNHLVVPRYVLHTLYEEKESADETGKARARRALDVIKKLDTLPALSLRYTDMDVPEVKDSLEKLVKLARMLNANVLTLDISQIKQAEVEDVRVIKFQSLCSSLKPLTQSGEYINIKIQRYGKEARQGVGYLEDGTMVVVNGGAEYIGETIRAQVLSVKHTSSGRMIFCNAIEDDGFIDDEQYMSTAQPTGHAESRQPSDYFAH